MFDGIEYRGSGQDIVETLGRYAGVPVWNGLTTEWHPTQMLADMLTMLEHSNKHLNEISYCDLGDAHNNTARSLLVAGALLGMDVRLSAPESLWPEAELRRTVTKIAEETGARILMSEDIDGAVRDVDYLYTDVWVSMGEPAETWADRVKLLMPYQVNAAVVKATGNRRVRFMHCLLPCTTEIPALVRSCSNNLASPNLRSPTMCSNRTPRSSSTRPKIVCTPSKPSWSQLLGTKSPRARSVIQAAGSLTLVRSPSNQAGWPFAWRKVSEFPWFSRTIRALRKPLKPELSINVIFVKSTTTGSRPPCIHALKTMPLIAMSSSPEMNTWNSPWATDVVRSKNGSWCSKWPCWVDEDRSGIAFSLGGVSATGDQSNAGDSKLRLKMNIYPPLRSLHHFIRRDAASLLSRVLVVGFVPTFWSKPCRSALHEERNAMFSTSPRFSSRPSAL